MQKTTCLALQSREEGGKSCVGRTTAFSATRNLLLNSELQAYKTNFWNTYSVKNFKN
jgi:hypothetical protein